MELGKFWKRPFQMKLNQKQKQIVKMVMCMLIDQKLCHICKIVNHMCPQLITPNIFFYVCQMLMTPPNNN